MTKPYPIPKAWVWEACQSVKANGGSAGIDRETLETFERRLGGLELHPDKTRIVHCKDSNRRGDYPVTASTFLGHTFRPRKAVDK